MLPCASSSIFLFVFTVLHSVYAAKVNDTVVVGSLIHETKIKPPSDLRAASSLKDHKHSDLFGDNRGKEGFFKSRTSKDNDGYNTFDSFNTKDGDSFGYEKHSTFGKKGGGKKNGGYREGNDFDDDDGEAAGSLSLKYTPLHFDESDGSSSAKRYRYESDRTGKTNGKLVGPDYVESREENKNKKRLKRKKEQQADATEYDNYDTYGDIEEADDVEADDGDPEYGAQYADADAYDYY